MAKRKSERIQRSETGLEVVGENSNPSFSALEAAFRRLQEATGGPLNLVWQQSVAAKHPYRLAELRHFNYDLSKRWYVIFYAWDVAAGAVRRKRLFDPINRKKSVPERIAEAEVIIAQVNRELREGKVLGKEKQIDVGRVNLLTLSLLEAVDYVKEQKRTSNHRATYLKSFTRLRGALQKWLELKQRPDLPLRNLSEDLVFSFFEYLQNVQRVGNKTYNNYRNDFTTVINFLMKRNAAVLKNNPVAIIDSLPVINRKHAAFTDEQMKAVQAACIALDKDALLLKIMFIYYTLARPSEIVQLKVGDIDLKENRIFFSGSISKNRRDEYVGIPAALKKIIRQSGILGEPGHHFIFGRSGRPGPRPSNYLWFYKQHLVLLKHCGFDKLRAQHSLYSYKHSGAISLYKATKDIKLLQAQCRHTGLDQTNHYLRDIGVIVGFDALHRWKGAI